MKYLVNISYTNPAHEHVSLRRRVESTSRLVEARSEEEAVFRASNQQKALGFFVTEAKATAIQEAAKKVDFMKLGKDIISQRLVEKTDEAVSFGRSGGVMHYDPKTEKSEKPAKGVSALDKDGNLVGHYRDLETAKKMKPGHTYQTSKGVAKEEVEQTDEALLPKQQKVADKLKASELAANKEKAGYKFGKSLRDMKVAAKMKKEEVEQINELSPATYTSAAQKARGQGTAYAAKATTQAGAAMYGSQQGKHEPNSPAAKMHAFAQKRFNQAGKFEKKAGLKPGGAGIHSYDPTPGDKGYSKGGPKPLTREEVEYIEEKLTAADPASEWIKDFVASDNPKFEGKSKKERIQMALGAYYAAKRAKNEATEKKYNEKEVKHAEKKQDKKQGSLNKIEMEPEIEMHSKGVK
jgi:hypothetical protein